MAGSSALTRPANGNDPFLMERGVEASRSVDPSTGQVSVTIKISDTPRGDSLTSAYRLPVVGYTPTVSADTARLRKLQAEEDERRRREALARLGNQGSSADALKLGYTFPATESTMFDLQGSESKGVVAWGVDRAGGDRSFNYYNLYRDGDPKEAVKVTADAAFGALGEWMTEQQELVERQFKERLETVIAQMRAEKEQSLAELKIQMEEEAIIKMSAALTALRAELEAAFARDKAAALEALRRAMETEAAEKLASALTALRAELEAAAAADKAAALAALRQQMEAAAAAALEALRAQMTREKEDALASLEARLTADFTQKITTMQADYEARLAELQERMRRMAEEHSAEIYRLKAEAEAALRMQAEAAARDKAVALSELRDMLENEKARALSDLESRLRSEFESTISALKAEAAAALASLRDALEREKAAALSAQRAEMEAEKAAALADLDRRLRDEFETRIRALTEELRTAQARVSTLEREIVEIRAAAEAEKEALRGAALARYDDILAELNQVLNLSIAGAMTKVGETVKLTEGFRDEIASYNARSR